MSDRDTPAISPLALVVSGMDGGEPSQANPAGPDLAPEKRTIRAYAKRLSVILNNETDVFPAFWRELSKERIVDAIRLYTPSKRHPEAAFETAAAQVIHCVSAQKGPWTHEQIVPAFFDTVLAAWGAGAAIAHQDLQRQHLGQAGGKFRAQGVGQESRNLVFDRLERRLTRLCCQSLAGTMIHSAPALLRKANLVWSISDHRRSSQRRWDLCVPFTDNSPSGAATAGASDAGGAAANQASIPEPSIDGRELYGSDGRRGQAFSARDAGSLAEQVAWLSDAEGKLEETLGEALAQISDSPKGPSNRLLALGRVARVPFADLWICFRPGGIRTLTLFHAQAMGHCSPGWREFVEDEFERILVLGSDGVPPADPALPEALRTRWQKLIEKFPVLQAFHDPRAAEETPTPALLPPDRSQK